MPIKELRETIDGDRCITFYSYNPKSNTKHYSDTFVLTPGLNILRLKRNFIRGLKKIEQESNGVVIQMRPAVT